MRFLQAFWTDVVRGARALAKSPGFATAAILTLGLGIGANSATFSVMNAVLLQPLPYSRPETRVMIWSRWKGFDKTWLSEAEILDYRKLVPSLAQVAAWSSGQANITGGDEDPVRIGIGRVTANVFSTLGAVPLLGRAFEPSEEAQGAGNVAVLSFGLWQRRFGAGAAALGKSLLVDAVPRQVVGVMPAGFQLPTDFGEDAAEPTALWIPLSIDVASPSRGNHGFYGAAELRPGATAVRATAELDALLKNQAREGLYHPDMRMTALAVPVTDEILGSVRPALVLVFGAVSLLLLIACANVANLLLARAEVRQREIAVRAALGAGHGHILRQLAAESVALAVPAGVLGLLLAWASLRAIVASGVAGVPRADHATIDARVLAFTAATALLTTFLFGLAPTLRALRLNLTETLRDGGAASAGASRQRLRGLLVVGELALSVVLLTGAGLVLKGLWSLQRVELGFEPRGVLTARVALPQTGYQKPEEVVAFYRQLLERVRALPGVTTAGLIRLLPLGAQIGDWGLMVEGRPNTPGNSAKGDWQVASDGGIEALGERLLRGRSFEPYDTSDSDQVALINETMARRYWPGVDPIGLRFRQGGESRPWISVVGIVRDVRHNGVTAPIKEKFYRPHSQFHRSSGSPIRNMTLVVKTAGDPMALAAPLRAAVRALDPTLPVAAVRPMTDVVAAAMATPRLTSGLLAVFAALAVALSAVGIYGVLSYLVSQRSQEIGIRMAIGADRAQVLRHVMAGGLRLSLIGILLGSAAALALARFAASLLHEVRPHDPATFVAVPLLLLALALVASYLPARRATRVDPLAALRAQ